MAASLAYNGGFASIQEALASRNIRRLSDWYLQNLREESAVTTSQMSALLQDGLRSIMFSRFAGIPSTWERFAQRATSNKEIETWVELGRLGTLTAVGEGVQ